MALAETAKLDNFFSNSVLAQLGQTGSAAP